MKFKLAIIGSRGFTDYNLLSSYIKNILNINNISIIISGGAVGADSLGERFADDNNIKKQIFYPEWNKYGKSAGMRRNVDIIKNADLIFAFWDGKSYGTKNSLELAEKYNKKIYLVKYEKTNDR